MADPIYKNSDSIGKETTDLILKTAGKIIIKVKDKYYPLEFKNKNKDIKTINTIIIDNSNSITDRLPQIASDTLFITKSGEQFLYLAEENNVVQLGTIEGASTQTIDNLIVNDSLTIFGELKIQDATLIENLNAQFLGGFLADDFLRNNINNTISGVWTFEDKTYVKNLVNTSGYYLDLEKGVLHLDKIECSQIISDDCVCANEDEGEPAVQDTSEIQNNLLVDAISARTYITDAPRILSVKYLENDFDTTSDFDIVYNGILTYGVEGDNVPTEIANILNGLFTFSLNEEEVTLAPGDEEDLSLYLIVKKTTNYWDSWTINSETITNYLINNTFDITAIDQEKYSGLSFILTLDHNIFKTNEPVVIETKNGILDCIVTNSIGDTISIITNDLCKGSELDTCYNDSVPFKGGVVLKIDLYNIIGNLNNITDDFFGKLSGHGIIMKNNCYLLNSEIALQKNDVNYLLISNTKPTFIGLSDSGHFIELGDNGEGNITTNSLHISSNNVYIGKSSSGNFLELDNIGFGSIKTNYLTISSSDVFIGLSSTGHFFELDSNGYGHIKNNNLHISDSEIYIGKSTAGHFFELDTAGSGIIKTQYLTISDSSTYLGIFKSGRFLELDSNGYGHIHTSNIHISDSETYIGKSNSGRFLELDSNGYGTINTDYISIGKDKFNLNVPMFSINDDGSGTIGTEFSWDSLGRIHYNTGCIRPLYRVLVNENGTLSEERVWEVNNFFAASNTSKWNGTTYEMVNRVTFSPVNAPDPYTLIYNIQVIGEDNYWWGVTAIHFDYVKNHFTQLDIRTIRPGEYISDMTRDKKPFVLTIYG